MYGVYIIRIDPLTLVMEMMAPPLSCLWSVVPIVFISSVLHSWLYFCWMFPGFDPFYPRNEKDSSRVSYERTGLVKRAEEGGMEVKTQSSAQLYTGVFLLFNCSWMNLWIFMSQAFSNILENSSHCYKTLYKIRLCKDKSYCIKGWVLCYY